MRTVLFVCTLMFTIACQSASQAFVASGGGSLELSVAFPGDLSRLNVGDTVTIEVSLASLPTGASLDSLFATFKYDATLLVASAPMAGEIVPAHPFNAGDFLATANEGLIDIAFSTLSLDPIHQIHSLGRFLSFQLTATAPGTTELTTDFVSATLFNADQPDQPLALALTTPSPLAVTVAAVPEPTTAWGIGMFVVAAWNAKRRRSP